MTTQSENSKSDVCIRPAVAADAEELSCLSVASKAWWGYDQAFMDQCQAELSVNAGDIEQPGAVWQVAVIDNQIAGFYALEPLRGRQMELDRFYMHPQFIGRGIGRLLIENAARMARQKNIGVMKIVADPHAVAFYIHAGARRVGSSPSGSIPGRYLPHLEINLDYPL